MKTEKSMNTLSLNISPTALNLFLESEILFYFEKIENAFPDTTVPECYGVAGSLIHDLLEKYAVERRELNYEEFLEYWNKKRLKEKKGFNGDILDAKTYFDCLQKGYYKINVEYNILETEKQYVFPLYDKPNTKINYKGIIDVVAERDGERVLVDWKTSNSVDTGENFRRQGLFYVYLYYRQTGRICPIYFEYLKLGIRKKFSFTEQEIKDFMKVILGVAKKIITYRFDKRKYAIGNIDSGFNQHKQKCMMEKFSRNKEKTFIVNIDIKNNMAFITNPLSERLLSFLDKNLSFVDMNAKYIQRNSKWNGVYKLFNVKHQCFRIGLTYRVLDILKKYAEKNNKKLEYTIRDSRGFERPKLDYFKDKLIGIELRDYQKQAVEACINHKIGIVQMVTSAGKSECAFELIREKKLMTLFIVNRKELMYQTKERMEKTLGINIGVIGDGEMDMKWVTVSTIQTLLKKKDEIADYLANVQMVICDETHIVASDSFRKVFMYLKQSIYRIGFSATPYRDDGKDMFIEEGVGKVIFTIDKKYLYDKGYIIKPTIKFKRVPEVCELEDGFEFSDALDEVIEQYEDYQDEEETEEFFKKYPDDYKKSIIFNKTRNNYIYDFVNQNPDKKILILVKHIKHGEMLEQNIDDAVYLHGSLGKKYREEIFEDFVKRDLKVMIATVTIASEGLNIPNLNIIINACANKGDVKSVQIIGRVMRQFKDKKEATYIDFIDNGKYTQKHSNKRIKKFRSEGHEIDIIDNNF